MAKAKFAVLNDIFPSFRSQHIQVKVAMSQWEKQEYFQLRSKTFTQEQTILAGKEKDIQDFQAIPIIAVAANWSIGEEIAGAVRIYKAPDQGDNNNIWYGGRLCVARSYRGYQSIGKALINEAVSRAKDLGCKTFLATVQPQNETYFKSVHWKTLGHIDVAGKPHVHMQANLDKYPFMPRDPQ
ncbi:MSMEG_0567/Sll0786 family nitrogen starvation N-acetyltransferase [Paraglaciecola sp. L3A3]|uniref:MSMEG_0567/Sll0786 family nitrogen starvation N-acetyltransferase n=1 Tax=Paraglaciecola sp. L3A3 TaxID=2686358 RepID=UPI00131DF38F|nr:MSMEG_0567/Sll0786 family nitrogen starvation N-acetyltransferase [Paraglaciecola sp. L3A3]